jgi:putative transposase
MSEIPFREPGRHTPAKGVHVALNGPNWVFLTVCTEKRGQWLAQLSVQRTLHDIWQNTATAWLVSDYLLMPDHLHLFCAPHDLKFTIERWIGFWKDQLAKNLKSQAARQRRPTKNKWAGQSCRFAHSRRLRYFCVCHF